MVANGEISSFRGRVVFHRTCVPRLPHAVVGHRVCSFAWSSLPLGEAHSHIQCQRGQRPAGLCTQRRVPVGTAACLCPPGLPAPGSGSPSLSRVPVLPFMLHAAHGRFRGCVCPRVCPRACVPACVPGVPVCPRVCVPVCPCVCVPTCVPVCPRVCPRVCVPLSVSSCVCPPCPRVSPHVCPRVCVPARVFSARSRVSRCVHLLFP